MPVSTVSDVGWHGAWARTGCDWVWHDDVSVAACWFFQGIRESNIERLAIGILVPYSPIRTYGVMLVFHVMLHVLCL